MKIIKGRVYRHFKGDYYIVIDTALNNENEQVYVIYRALYGNGELFVRPLEDFTSKVDKTKHPSVAQEYKFEIQDISSINPSHK